MNVQILLVLTVELLVVRVQRFKMNAVKLHLLQTRVKNYTVALNIQVRPQ